MAYLLPHLRTGWAVDQAIVNEEDRVVVIRFGHDHDPVCMIQDEGTLLAGGGSAAAQLLTPSFSCSNMTNTISSLLPLTLVFIVLPPPPLAVLQSIAEPVKNFAVVYVVDITQVPEFNDMYELFDPCTTMFFYRNKHIMVDLGTGNNNKINWALADKQEFIDIIEIVYRGARKGRGLVVSPKDYSTKYKY